MNSSVQIYIRKDSEISLVKNIITQMYPNKVWMNFQGTRFFVYYDSRGVFSRLDIYSIQNSTISQIQRINFPNSIVLNYKHLSSKSGDQLVITYTNKFAFLKYNGSKYNQIINTTLAPTPASHSRSLSPDAKYFVYGESFIAGGIYLKVFQIDQVLQTITQAAMQNLAVGGTSGGNVIATKISENNNAGKYDLLCTYKIDTSYVGVYYIFDSNTNMLIFVHQLYHSPTLTSFGYTYSSSAYLTSNGQYFGIYQNNFKVLVIYQKISGNYQQIFRSVELDYENNPVYISEDASIIVAATRTQYFQLYLSCAIEHCIKCNWKNICGICESDFILENNQCVCSQGYSLVNDTCIQCDINYCQHCAVTNICSSCKNGYSLNFSSCDCDRDKNISQISGNCVQCNIPKCYKCSFDNVCDVFQSNEAKIQQISKVLVAIISVVCLLLAGLVFIMIKLFQLKAAQTKIIDSSNTMQQTIQTKQNLSLGNQKSNLSDNQAPQSLIELKKKKRRKIKNDQKISQIQEIDLSYSFNNNSIENINSIVN